MVVPKLPNVGRGAPKAEVLPPNSPPVLGVEEAAVPNKPPDDDVAPNPVHKVH